MAASCYGGKRVGWSGRDSHVDWKGNRRFLRTLGRAREPRVRFWHGGWTSAGVSLPENLGSGRKPRPFFCATRDGAGVLESSRLAENARLIAGRFIPGDWHVRFALLFFGGASKVLHVFPARCFPLSMCPVLRCAPVVYPVESCVVLRVHASFSHARVVPS